jgi:hypothetical protein
MRAADGGSRARSHHPKVGKNEAVPLTARANIDARMNPNTASNAVFATRNAGHRFLQARAPREDDHSAHADLGEGEGCGIAARAQDGVDVDQQL